MLQCNDSDYNVMIAICLGCFWNSELSRGVVGMPAVASSAR